MFVACFQVTSDHELALLRIDLSDDGSVATYQLQDALGDIHEWRVSMAQDETSKTYRERAAYALCAYLFDCSSNGWNGDIRLVQSGIGIPDDYWDVVKDKFMGVLALSRMTRPEGAPLQ